MSRLGIAVHGKYLGKIGIPGCTDVVDKLQIIPCNQLGMRILILAVELGNIVEEFQLSVFPQSCFQAVICTAVLHKRTILAIFIETTGIGNFSRIGISLFILQIQFYMRCLIQGDVVDGI